MRVMLIMPSFFNYPDVLVEEMSGLGIECDRFNDRPSDNSIVKAIVRLRENSLKITVDNMVKSMVQRAKERNYDKILFVSGQSLSLGRAHIEMLRSCLPKSELILYQWDSISNYPRMVRMLDLFDRAYSFDRRDCEQFGMQFLPLFFHKGYKKISEKDYSSCDPKYDLSFIGTAHPKKHQFLKEVVKSGNFDINSCFLYEFLPSRLVYFRHKIMEGCYKGDQIGDFYFQPLTPLETEDVVARSKIVLDSPQSNQLGLTIRTIECLGAGRKLITTNSDVLNYDFYSEKNIYVYNGNFDLSHDFFNSDYEPISPEIVDSYSLSSWLKRILGI